MRLYLPEAWTDDRERCDAAGVPSEVAFKKKWEIALDLLDQAFAWGMAKMPVLADAGYGEGTEFRDELVTPRPAICRRRSRQSFDLASRVQSTNPQADGQSWATSHASSRCKHPADQNLQACRRHPAYSVQDGHLASWLSRKDVIEVLGLPCALRRKAHQRQAAYRRTVAHLRMARIGEKPEVPLLQPAGQHKRQRTSSNRKAPLARRARLSGDEGRAGFRPFRGQNMAGVSSPRDSLRSRSRLPGAPTSAFPPGAK